MKARLKFSAMALLVSLALKPAPLLACAACYGQSDSSLAKGMNWGIFTLLGVVVTVLGCITSFFVYLGKKSASADTATPANSSQAAAEKD